MKSTFAALAFLGALLGAFGALAQPAERLARPVQPSYMGADGRLVVDRNATMGNQLVDQYANFGRRLFAPNANRAAMTEALRPYMCDRQGSGAYASDLLVTLLRDKSAETRAQLQARDAASLTDLAIEIAAGFDRVSADAIRADEALGPGVYHDAINGFSVALDVCDFFGQARRLRS